ncbi:hypothetical protein CDD82_6764 [Ophiocordyceps australis]|uniref:Cystathionine gamma-synthase n=1 Tax=Ophiocordyceps australis TaxID=1399860 RepID=A0A2C5YQM8_9HYPO|nr:hypothetical protein CDD82_6764 [Ophiocordyceps australis]
MASKLGDKIPDDEHAVSVSLPKWTDVEGWARRDDAVISQLQTGYPRFFIHRKIVQLANEVGRWAGKLPQNHACRRAASASGKTALLLPSEWMALICQAHLERHDKEGKEDKDDDIQVVYVGFDGQLSRVTRGAQQEPARSVSHRDLYVVLYPQRLWPHAKAFWQHTGFGISSRFAAYWLGNAPFVQESGLEGSETVPVQEAAQAALTLGQRLGDLYEAGLELVFLYPTGMSAMARTALGICSLQQQRGRGHRVGVFGFLYVDTLKVLSEVCGFDCVLYGQASVDALQADLEAGASIDALYTEFAGNPLLGSADLGRLHALSQTHGFVLVVDDTVGTPVNVDVARRCDVVCSSLTKMFSGACNVMGGSAVVSPSSRRREALCQALGAHQQQTGGPATYFASDLVVMERNSRDFAQRVATASRNAQALSRRLRRHPAVDTVYYPLGSPTQHLYDCCRRPGAGYGYLLSVCFVSPRAARAFHDGLDMAKGPSLGTNFSLCCAYTLLAHAAELEWAAEHGVVEHLVRISVGVEDLGRLERVVDAALAAAAEAEC